eukprot:52019_1
MASICICAMLILMCSVDGKEYYRQNKLVELDQYYENYEDFDEYYDALYNYYEDTIAVLEQYYETWEEYLNALISYYDYVDDNMNDNTYYKDEGIGSWLSKMKKKIKTLTGETDKKKTSPIQNRKIESEEIKNGLKVTKFTSICQCSMNPFNANKGLLWINENCIGKLAIWLIPEEASDPAFDQVSAGQWHPADGFKWGLSTYKIDGSTCAQINCTISHMPHIYSCVNLIALAMGKKAPYIVPYNTFQNHPPLTDKPRHVVAKKK